MDSLASAVSDCVVVARELALSSSRRSRSRRSKLDRHRAELLTLHADGLTYDDMKLWLRRERRCLVAKSTLHHRLTQWLAPPTADMPSVEGSRAVVRTPPRPKRLDALPPKLTRAKSVKGIAGLSPREQAERILGRLCVFGEKKQRGRPGFSDDHIHSVSSHRTYAATLAVAYKEINQQRPLKKLRDITLRDIERWMATRKQQNLATSTLLRDRRVMRLLLIALGREDEAEHSIFGVKPQRGQKGRLATALRYYTEGQWGRIAFHQNARNRLATELAARCGLRAQGLLTLMPPGLREKSTARSWRADRFAGMQAIELWTVKEKNGLVREVAMPEDLAQQLRARAYDTPRKIIDRGLNFETLFDVGGGRCWSGSFTQASRRVLGWSAGGHGLRHTYADGRVEQLQTLGYSYADAMEITSQELGHFRARVTHAYLR